MATLLPTISHSPFSGSFVTKPYRCSTSPSPSSLARNGSTNSISTIHHLKQRSRSSSSSYISIVSARGSSLQVRNENHPPIRNVLLPTQDVAEEPNYRPHPWRFALTTRDEGTLDDVDLDDDGGFVRLERQKRTDEVNVDENAQEIYPENATDEVQSASDTREGLMPVTEEPGVAECIPETTSHPFRRWMSTLRRKNSSRGQPLVTRTERWSLDDSQELNYSHRQREIGHSRHQKTSSHSSSAFITAVKTASVSLASLSVAPRSRHAARSSRFRSEHRNSGQSQYDFRPSMETTRKLSGPFMDEAAWDRALRRRKILEELVSSEESYVADLKVLANVYRLKSYLKTI